MNEQNQPPQPPQSGHQTPPPPPPGHQPPPYYGPPPQQRSSAVGSLTRLGGLLSLGLIVFIAGFYVALFAIGRDAGPSSSVYRDGEGNQKVAIIPVNGMIDNYTSQFVHRVVEDILDREDIGAVVLRVQSPGGGATASDEILHAVNRLSEEAGLPVVASYGDYAASGGYYVSCQAERIFAQPTTVTGSIGVISPSFTVEELLDKIGVTPEIITSSVATEKDLATPLRSWTEEDRENMRRLLDSIQEQFVKVVAEGRADWLDEDGVRELATGRIFTADEAVESQLVDEIGYLDDAIGYAVGRGEFEQEEPPAVMYRPATGLAGLFSAQARARTSAPTPMRIDAETIRQWAHELSVPRMMFLWQN